MRRTVRRPRRERHIPGSLLVEYRRLVHEAARRVRFTRPADGEQKFFELRQHLLLVHDGVRRHAHAISLPEFLEPTGVL
jgi:hypothetical protein